MLEKSTPSSFPSLAISPLVILQNGDTTSTPHHVPSLMASVMEEIKSYLQSGYMVWSPAWFPRTIQSNPLDSANPAATESIIPFLKGTTVDFIFS